MTRYILDASAVLALLLAEAGAEQVLACIPRSCIGAVNWSEVLAKQVRMGHDPALAVARLQSLNLAVVPFDESLARATGLLEAEVQPLGLGLGDRACLALGQALRLPVLTADRSWARLRVGVTVRLIR